MAPYDAPITCMDMMYRFIGLDHHLVNKWPSIIGSEVSFKLKESERQGNCKGI